MADGDEQTLDGELALLTGTRRSASVQAVRDCELLEIESDRFLGLLGRDPELSIGLARALARQLQASGGVVEPESQPSVVAVARAPGVDAAEFSADLCSAFAALGVTAAISNALIHGRPPATVRIWAAPGRIVISVHDQGRGPADPLAGLVPAPRGTATLGLGLWVIHQLDIDVALKHADDGFTIRLRGGTTIG